MSNHPQYTPEGYSTVSPYLVAESVEQELDFLKNALGATLMEQMKQPNGTLMHGEAKIGNTVIMIGVAREDTPATKSMMYIYTENVDATYENALKHGATSIAPPRTEFYGDRAGGIASPQGNQYWIAQKVEQVDMAEAEKRFAEMVQG